MAATHYKIDHTAQAVAQAEAICEWAESKGRGDALLVLLPRIFRSLKRDPLKFGDPQYNTKLSGGVVRHGIEDGISVRFVVFQKERAVLVLTLKAAGHKWSED